jgi:hypothetical protein
MRGQSSIRAAQKPKPNPTTPIVLDPKQLDQVTVS